MKFQTGQVLFSAGGCLLVEESKEFCSFISSSLQRHKDADWDSCCKHDQKANNDALKHGGRLFSVYKKDNWKLWIITEHDRSVTRLLFPEEY